MTPLAAYVLLFVAVGAGFILVNLLVGKLIRPSKPDAEKGTIYECGEPTIGSAWVQFDLRYYVVALLFVIFDVEVAFFFPWAEVFGKANAVATLPELTTAGDYRKASEAALDLGVRGGGVRQGRPAPSAMERRKWEALSKLTPEGLAAFQSLSPRELAGLRELTPAQLATLWHMTDSLAAAYKVEGDRLKPVVEKVSEGRIAAVRALQEGLRKGKVDERGVDELAGESVELLRGLSLRALQTLPPLLANATAPNGAPVRMPLARTHRKLLAEADAVGDRLAAELRDAAAAAEAALKAVSSKEGGIPPGELTPLALRALGGLSNETRRAMREGDLALPAFLALDGERSTGAIIPRAKEQARTLTWLALIEVLIFFGVLLVGFAYLWRRGDIEWVRSTAAEKPEHVGENTKETAPTSGA